MSPLARVGSEEWSLLAQELSSQLHMGIDTRTVRLRFSPAAGSSRLVEIADQPGHAPLRQLLEKACTLYLDHSLMPDMGKAWGDVRSKSHETGLGCINALVEA